jgi:endonuclease/exonuclease/phosphatase family metal-dependent hydrolase
MSRALNVMTFNIRHGRALDGANRWYRRRKLVFDTIRSHQPHVLGLQEVDPFQLDELAAAFPTFGVIAHRRYGGLTRVGGAYAPILFDSERLEAGQSGDFWLAPDPEGRRVRAWDAAVVRICTWAVLLDRTSGERFAVLNSHFDQRGVEARVHSAELVAERLDALAHLPRLFTVDLNANEDSDPLAILVKAGMRDSYRDVHPAGSDDRPAFTYHRFRGTRSRGVLGKIDFILCDDRWTVTGAEIVRDDVDGRWPSDHYPVTADLALGDAGAGWDRQNRR